MDYLYDDFWCFFVVWKLQSLSTFIVYNKQLFYALKVNYF